MSGFVCYTKYTLASQLVNLQYQWHTESINLLFYSLYGAGEIPSFNAFNRIASNFE